MSTGSRLPPVCHRTSARVLGANGFVKIGATGWRDLEHSWDRTCCRIGEEVTLNAAVDEEFRERRMLREAPERSMVTVVALAYCVKGQWRSIGPRGAVYTCREESCVFNGSIVQAAGSSQQELRFRQAFRSSSSNVTRLSHRKRGKPPLHDGVETKRRLASFLFRHRNNKS